MAPTQQSSETTVLLVEDERDIREPLAEYLTKNGLQVVAVADAAEARARLAARAFDIIISDIMMPGEDGLSFTQYVRATFEIPVILLTARTEETERIVGLEIGADDYVTKPFSPRELLARIKVVLRRARRSDGKSMVAEGEAYSFDKWVLKIDEQALVDRDGVQVPLSTGEFRLLEALVRHPGQVLSRDRLLDITQGRDAAPFDRAIDNQVSRLRRKIEDDVKAPALIKTIWGGGYSLSARVQRL